MSDHSSDLFPDASSEPAAEKTRGAALVETRLTLMEIGLIFGAWSVMLAVPLASIVMGSCCGGDNPPQTSTIVATLVSNMLPWVIGTIPVF